MLAVAMRDKCFQTILTVGPWDKAIVHVPLAKLRLLFCCREHISYQGVHKDYRKWPCQMDAHRDPMFLTINLFVEREENVPENQRQQAFEIVN